MALSIKTVPADARGYRSPEPLVRAERAGRLDDALERRLVAHDAAVTQRVAGWAYLQAERAGATVWERGRDGTVGLDPRWRQVLTG